MMMMKYSQAYHHLHLHLPDVVQVPFGKYRTVWCNGNKVRQKFISRSCKPNCKEPETEVKCEIEKFVAGIEAEIHARAFYLRLRLHQDQGQAQQIQGIGTL